MLEKARENRNVLCSLQFLHVKVNVLSLQGRLFRPCQQCIECDIFKPRERGVNTDGKSDDYRLRASQRL